MAATRGSSLNLAATRPLVLGITTTGAPFTSIKSAAGQTDADNLVAGFNSIAIQVWDKLVAFRDFFALFLLLNAIHLAITTRIHSDDTPAGDCAVNSWVIIFIQVTTFALLIASSIIRQMSAFSVAAETVLGLTLVAVAIVMAAATGPFRWKLEAGVEDHCSAAANPSAWGVFLLADVLGTGSILLILLSIYAKPFLANNSLGSVVLAAIFFIVIQYTVLELWLVPELAKVWEEIEVNGTSIDSTLNDVNSRLTDIETLFNITVR